MEYVLKVVVAAVIIMGTGAATLATPVPVMLVGDDFNNLLGGSASAVGSPTITDMSVDNLLVDVISQAFTDGAGNYAYLYQVKNIGTLGNNVVEAFTASPFFGASAITTLGYLTANTPTGFTLGAQTAYAASIDAVAGPTISFAFPAFLSGYAIDPGEWSSTLYVLSDGAPATITGNVIDGWTTSGDVVGPVPEPATMSMLALGGLAMIRRKGRK